MNEWGRRYLLMTAGGHPYLLPLEQVSEVLEPRPLSLVPRSPAWCSGALQSGGVVVAVIDLSMYMGDDRQEKPDRIVVLDTSSGGVAMLVEHVEDLPVADEGMFERDIHGCWLETAAGRAELLDVHELVQEISAAMSS